MVNACSVYGCTMNSKNNSNLRFHGFPKDARCQLWVDACQKPNLKNKTIKQLSVKRVCSLHFPKWMYKKMNLKETAVPVLNLPTVPIDAMSSQTETKRTVIVGSIKCQRNEDGQYQIDETTVDESIAASSNAEISQTGNERTDDTPKPTEFLSIKIKDVTSLSTASSDVISDSDTQVSTEKLRDDLQRKRKFETKTTICAKKMKLIEDIKPKNITLQQYLKGCDKFLSPTLSKIVKTQINLKHHSSNNRYSNEFKQFCLNNYISSPQAYKYLSKILCLPSQRILATSVIPVNTKITDYIWGVLSQVVRQLSPSEKECTFCMDVRRLKPSHFYDTNRDKTIGLHDIDDIQSPYTAGYVLTVMLRGLLKDWKQVVGYAFIKTDKTLNESLEGWIVNTIKQLFALGFKIRAIVSDQGSDFINFAERRGISKQKPYFEIEGRKMYYIFDVPDLITSVRNNLIKYDFEFNGKIVSWNDIYECYQLDKQKDFRLAPKLTDSHILPKNFQKNKVHLAAQVFSNSVKAAVETYTEAGNLYPRDGTVEFIDTMNKLIDVLNSSNIYPSMSYNEPYRNTDLQRNLLLKVQNLLSNLKVKQKDPDEDVSTTLKFIKAFSVSIDAIMQLYDDLKEETGSGEFCLLTRRLNNDGLDFFFSILRQAGGGKKPTCILFERTFRKYFLCQIFKLINEKKCTDDYDSVLSQFSNFTQEKTCVITGAKPEADPLRLSMFGCERPSLDLDLYND